MAHKCEMCPNVASLYCDADSCYLCVTCDQKVHCVNRFAQRHIRRPVDASEGSEHMSAGDESEPGLVPDVEESGQMEHANRLERKKSTLSKESDTTAISLDEATEYDLYDFANLEGEKMPSLGIEDDSLFPSKGFGKSMQSELSWESMIPDPIEHVVPDVEVETLPTSASLDPTSNCEMTERAGYGKKMDAQKSSNTILSCSLATDAGDDTQSLTTKDDEEMQVESSDTIQKGDIAKTDLQTEGEARQTPEQRRKLRMEALARFRSKRANRSFAKKVRYECRKQLADSRPRVKGRFVKKSEMALYRKYGALYRDHLHESTSETSNTRDQCVPAL